MAVPKKKKSKSRRDMRRAHHDVMGVPTVIECPKCQEITRPHRVCSSCGYYKNREVIAKPAPAAAEAEA